MTSGEISKVYFDWMYHTAMGKTHSKDVSYRKLLTHLHSREFIFSLPRDDNRACDGVDLRRRFSLLTEYKDATNHLKGPCSVLEMMVALSVRCEENIMDDPAMGDRTSQWFWGMISSLGLSSMMDTTFDESYVDKVITTFLNREYQPNGKGGLFTIKNYKRDLRTVEIWVQLGWYINTIR